MTLTEDLDKGVSHSLGRAAGLEYLSHHNTETDDDADASERVSETVLNRSDKIERYSVKIGINNREASDNTDKQSGDQHCKKCVYLCFKYQKYENNYAYNQGNEHPGTVK